MSLRSRKRNRSYLRKIWYLRNFLNLLKIYRAYLQWKYRKRRKYAIEWLKCDAILWKIFTLRWNPAFFSSKVYATTTTVIYHFFKCQLTVTTCVISNSTEPFSSYYIIVDVDMSIDKFFVICLSHETRPLREFLIALSRRKETRIFIENF